jgi:hypothetical protein
VRVGWIASGVGHAALILALVFAGAFTRAPLPPLEVAQVTVISEEEFALLARPETAPEAGPGISAPAPPHAPLEAPPPPSRPNLSQTQDDPAPETAGAPELAAPPPVEAPPLEQPVPDAAPRVATEAAPAPPPEAEEGPVETEAAAPEPGVVAETEAEEADPAAPPEASTEILTEAEEPSGSPEPVRRPAARPDRLARLDAGRSFEASSLPEPEASSRAEPEPQEPAEDPLAAAVAAAVAEAVASTPETAPDEGAAAGPPLSQGERDAFRVAVERCWIVDPGSPAASVTVVVGMRMTREAKPDTASISLLGSQGGDDGAVRTAYEAARRAILRCGVDGFPLPAGKYERWARVEMTFNPEGMRVR